ncbi:unnamed protein product [Acanthoscelides obtectus]|uniref:Uncharacterized protein n=1 Tax=Acanthoscelides obtectus TaxID=200917 RepID=A0A9P0NW69_ACAOB|nr:unnamed protein product [Acanthoscelides obtectus]CAK1668202.1 hypothetical protein AOBTE_LOCUS26278 [Acanthoscelides obtectus]
MAGKEVYTFRELENMSSNDLYALLESIPSDGESDEPSSDEDDLLDIPTMPIIFEDDQPARVDNSENIFLVMKPSQTRKTIFLFLF